MSAEEASGKYLYMMIMSQHIHLGMESGEQKNKNKIRYERNVKGEVIYCGVAD